MRKLWAVITITFLNALLWWSLIYFKLTIIFLLIIIVLILSLTTLAFIFNKGKQKYYAGAVFILFVFLCGNFLTYIYSKAQLYQFFLTDPQLGWKAGKNLQHVPLKTKKKTYYVSTNHMGFRGKWPDNNEVVNVIQGDSNVFGYGLAEPQTLAARLTQEGSRLCVNLGTNGYDLHQYILQYQALKPKLRVKHRLVIFILGNDYACSTMIAPYFYPRPYLGIDQESGKLRVIRPPVSLAVQEYGLHFIPSLSRYDHLVSSCGEGYDLLDGVSIPDYLLQIPLAKWTLERMMHGPTGKALFKLMLNGANEKPSPPDGEAIMRPWYGSWCFLKTSHWPAPYRLFLSHFSKLLEVLRQQEAKTILILLPMRQQVIPAEHEAALQQLLNAGYSPDQIDFFCLNQEIMGQCREKGLTFLDLTPHYKAYPNPGELYQEADQHLNENGTELVSAAISNFLEERAKKEENSTDEK